MEDDGRDAHQLDLENADRHVWLMKSPVVVSKTWEKLTPPSSSSFSSYSSPGLTSLAKVVESVNPLQPEPEFNMEMVGAEYGNMPKSYSLNMFKDFVPMSVLSAVDLEENPAAEGTIEQKFDMKPQGEDIEEYARLCRERTSRSMVKNRQIQVIDNDRGVHMRFLPGLPNLLSSNSRQEKRKAVPVKQTDVKRTRRDRGELEGIMFNLFEGQPNWTLKQLVQKTDQPAQFLKEILNELCVYNKRGSNQGTYELKPEYKKAGEDDTGGQ
ncbi:transcription initiation factor IIF subunit beta isoform X1 [Raphanus sativus]|uniref:Transcription initiation factor IIF subunit beta isoform X1 n=1 Tax=Raphanus sativus TaxID=3726 RepID=A0A9W3CNG3_RAPSA|nr:transcription initiation factor IIF subunit beta isoform X1 [Raphanus sativus]